MKFLTKPLSTDKWITKVDYRKEITGLKLDIFLIILILWFVFVFPLAFLIFYFVFFDLPVFPHTLLPFKTQSKWLLYIIFMPFYTYAIFAFNAIALFHISVVIDYLGNRKE